MKGNIRNGSKRGFFTFCPKFYPHILTICEGNLTSTYKSSLYNDSFI